MPELLGKVFFFYLDSASTAVVCNELSHSKSSYFFCHADNAADWTRAAQFAASRVGSGSATFGCVRPYVFDIVRDVFAGRSVDQEPCRQVVYRHGSPPSDSTNDGPSDGPTVQPLAVGDAATILARWAYRDDVDESFAHNIIALAPTVCVRGADGEALSWQVQYLSGDIGMVHTEPEARRRGYAAACGRALMSRVMGLPAPQPSVPFAFILQTNEVSQRMFAGLGFDDVGEVTWVHVHVA